SEVSRNRRARISRSCRCARSWASSRVLPTRASSRWLDDRRPRSPVNALIAKYTISSTRSAVGRYGRTYGSTEPNPWAIPAPWRRRLTGPLTLLARSVRQPVEVERTHHAAAVPGVHDEGRPADGGGVAKATEEAHGGDPNRRCVEPDT